MNLTKMPNSLFATYFTFNNYFTTLLKRRKISKSPKVFLLTFFLEKSKFRGIALKYLDLVYFRKDDCQPENSKQTSIRNSVTHRRWGELQLLIIFAKCYILDDWLGSKVS